MLNRKSLSCLSKGVEQALALGAVLLLSPALSWAESAEPDPRPQFKFNANSFGDESVEARLLVSQKKWPEAVIVLRSALKKSPNSVALEWDLARALMYSGRREEALTVLGQMQSRRKGAAQKDLIRRSRVLSRTFLTNSTFQIHQDGVNLMLTGKYRAAKERFEKALEQEPANVEVLTRLSQCLVLDGDFDSAAERLRLARRLNPHEPEIRLWLGRALHQRGEIREALVELKSAYQDLSTSESAAVWYADALFTLGQRGPSIQILDDDVKRHPMHVLGLVTLGRYRLFNASVRDSQAAWMVRKDLQLALSRLSSYVGTPPKEEGTDTVAPAESPLNSMGDLGLDLRRTEVELKREIQKLMEDADGRIEGERRKT